jgi:predicted kinase
MNQLKPTLVLVCGLPGAGKTTLSRQLAKTMPATLLNPDEEMVRRKLNLLDESARATVESDQWNQAKELLTAGKSVILDNGFWGRKERDSLRIEARQLGVNVKLYYLDVPLEELWKRIEVRNETSESNGVQLTRKQLENSAGWMQSPTTEESKLFD